MMQAGQELSPAVAAHVVDAVAFRLAGLLLERPRSGWWEEVQGVTSEVQDPTLVDAANLAEGADEAAYLGLLGPGGAISPRHAAHIGMEDPGLRLNRLMELYEAYGYRPRDPEDPPDHVAVEVGFVAFLSLKAAHAEASGDRAGQQVAANARRDFVLEHLGPLGRSMQDKLKKVGGAPRYLDLTLAVLERRGAAIAGA